MNGLLGIAMAPRTRRIVQAVLYELVAISLVTLAIAIFFDEGKGSALGLSVLMSSIALAWNYTFNAMFEWWEQRQSVKGRSSLRRLVHGIGFEGGGGGGAASNPGDGAVAAHRAVGCRAHRTWVLAVFHGLHSGFYVEFRPPVWIA